MNNTENILSSAARARRNFTKAAVRAAAAAAGAVALAVVARPVQVKAQFTCFLKGTKIRTVEGHCKIEDISIGDLLPSVSQGMQAVEWVGIYNYRKSDAPKSWEKDIRPVRLSKSAISEGLPCCDLYLSPSHALLIDGVLVQVRALINNTTIVQVDPPEGDQLAYYHIKLPHHDVIFAEGMPCESLLTEEELPYAPVLAFRGGRSEVSSRIRSAISPVFDFRRPLDVIRDRIEERGLMSSRA
jgi:hypothetical protein